MFPGLVEPKEALGGITTYPERWPQQTRMLRSGRRALLSPGMCLYRHLLRLHGPKQAVAS
jgi:hypothetical protein